MATYRKHKKSVEISTPIKKVKPTRGNVAALRKEIETQIGNVQSLSPQQQLANKQYEFGDAIKTRMKELFEMLYSMDEKLRPVIKEKEWT